VLIKVAIELKERSHALQLHLSRANHFSTEYAADDVKKYGLNLTEFAVLELLFHKGDQPIQKIGKKILISSGSITYVLDKLESKQLIERAPCAKDRRVIYGRLTEKGSAFMNQIFPQHQQQLEQFFSGLGEKEKEVLINLLKKIGQNIQTV
jgi:MarR family transcriptional regulator, 2-MHQ and catechol-resistance regulon repressor